MLIADLLHSCGDEGVAEAAVASIGGAFADGVRRAASRSGQSVGALTVSLVRTFARQASERDWRRLIAAMAGDDHPVLSGLRSIVESRLAADAPLPDRLERRLPISQTSLSDTPCTMA